MEIFDIFKTAIERNASDIHLTVGRPPMIRVQGEMIPIEDTPSLSAEDAKELIYSILYDEQKQKFEENLELDCSFQVPNLSRFRVNVLLQKDGIGAVLRIISSQIPDAEFLGLTPKIIELADLPRGLVLVTGSTGSGKSTTLACLINLINQKRRCHIITVEDPIEFVYENNLAVITQREVGQHTHTFNDALKHAMRQDPDVILVGEMRDLETIAAAITLGETGHLVFATLHTTDAAQTVDRIIDVFPSYQQQIRVQLSNVLEAVICQQLLPRADGQGRVAAHETMTCIPAISNLIREGKTHQIYTAIETGSKAGMVSMDKSLAELVKGGLVAKEEAFSKAYNPQAVENYIRGAGTSIGGSYNYR